MLSNRFLVTCEHGGNRVPATYRPLFSRVRKLLATHRGYDLGALVLARELSEALHATLLTSTISRLLVDLNRSVGHRALYSEATSALPSEERQQILKRYYRPYRSQAEEYVRRWVNDCWRVIHISSHSFTPVLGEQVRNADIGLLYDPARALEADLCRRWQSSIRVSAPQLKVRRNYPYAGKGDGLTTYLRKQFPPDSYVGVELEINQKHVIEGGRHWATMRKAVIASLRLALVGKTLT